MAMTFGERIREHRRAKDLTLRSLAAKVGVGFTYVSKIENGKLDFGESPSETLVCRLAKALDAEEHELLVLAKRSPRPLESALSSARMSLASWPLSMTPPWTGS
jgi:transcriptional regulator with XRE-family HTH domain